MKTRAFMKTLRVRMDLLREIIPTLTLDGRCAAAGTRDYERALADLARELSDDEVHAMVQSAKQRRKETQGN